MNLLTIIWHIFHQVLKDINTDLSNALLHLKSTLQLSLPAYSFLKYLILS